jgi:hypothetical protein
VTTSPWRLRVELVTSQTLAELEAACAAARAKGFGGDARVLRPFTSAAGLVIVEPYLEQPAPVEAPRCLCGRPEDDPVHGAPQPDGHAYVEQPDVELASVESIEATGGDA